MPIVVIIQPDVWLVHGESEKRAELQLRMGLGNATSSDGAPEPYDISIVLIVVQ